MSAHASDRVRERFLGDETGAEDRVREGLPPGAQAIEVLDLPRAEDLLRDQELSKPRLRARWLGARCFRRRDACGLADDAHDLLRRLVLGDVRGGAGCEGEVPNPRVESKEDDLRCWEVVAEHPSDFETGHTRHRVVEHDHVGTEL